MVLVAFMILINQQTTTDIYSLKLILFYFSLFWVFAFIFSHLLTKVMTVTADDWRLW